MADQDRLYGRDLVDRIQGRRGYTIVFIGAALGNAGGWLLGAPIDLIAGLGFAAVFAGAVNTPFACTIMGIELFGSANAVLIAVA